MIEEANVSDHWKLKFKTKIQQVLQNHKNLFWKKLDMFNDDVIMLIKFKNENNVSDLKQYSYWLSFKNWKVMNKILKCLKKNNWIKNVLLKDSSSAASSAFMTWVRNKSHVIIDLWKINTKLILNVYFLSCQNNILQKLEDFIIFFLLNITKSFFQQLIKKSDWWKIVFVSSYCDHEWLKINSMRLINSSEFF